MGLLDWYRNPCCKFRALSWMTEVVGRQHSADLRTAPYRTHLAEYLREVSLAVPPLPIES